MVALVRRPFKLDGGLVRRADRDVTRQATIAGTRHLANRVGLEGGVEGIEGPTELAMHPPLTAREELLYRAADRRTLRVATRIAGATAVGFSLVNGLSLAVQFPERRAAVLAFSATQAAIAISAIVVTRRHWRLPPIAIAFALALSAIGTVLSMLVFVPESRVMSSMLLAMFPPAMALFLPWSVRAHALWLLAFALVPLAFSTTALGAAGPAASIGVWAIFAISGVISLIGCASASGRRQRAFALQMRARRAHVQAVTREAELKRLNGELAEATRTDPLTGLGNRLRLEAEIADAAAHSARYDKDSTIVMFDLDRFKDYNDALGHVAGDAALRSVAAAMAANVRVVDIVCRFGGEEFVVLMPEQSLEGGARVAERIRCAIEALQFHYPTSNGPQVLTISAGVALLGRGAAHDEDEILRTVDAALYRAKRAGRNRVEGMPRSADRTIIGEQLEAPP
ncbi:MAG TPA: GGDEF domain-containing protein [Candidatus Saccharimonadales bacterium]|nr:GGDEF domain-containing protein [Candidatus Saccharimonadales bacterium]